MRVLITRPKEDADELAASLAARGIEAVVEPMLAIRRREGGPRDFAGAQALLVTSANGARALAAATARRDLPVLAVGPGSAAAARAAGFMQVTSADGDVTALAELCRRTLAPGKGRLVHAAGSTVAGDLAGALGAAGFEVERLVLYEAVPADALSARCAELLRERGLDAVLLFSPRTAATFVSLVRRAALADALGETDALCLSRAVADAAGAVRWRRILVATRPDAQSLLRLLDAAT
jgi:uroporphyrinogen-III synthase